MPTHNRQITIPLEDDTSAGKKESKLNAMEISLWGMDMAGSTFGLAIMAQ